MALPAQLLERFPASVASKLAANLQVASAARGSDGPFSVAAPGPSASPHGHRSAKALQLARPELAELEAALPDGGFPRGAVTELAVMGGAALGTSLGLAACRAAQQAAALAGGLAEVGAPSSADWCAFVDPTASLHAPGLAHAGVRLERLLVIRPPVDALARVAVRVVQARAFAVVVIDLLGVPGAPLSVPLGPWARTVRRLALALEGTETCVVLVTDAAAARPLPLPVALRIELARSRSHRLSLQVKKDRHGRVSGPRSITWARGPSAATGDEQAILAAALLA